LSVQASGRIRRLHVVGTYIETKLVQDFANGGCVQTAYQEFFYHLLKIDGRDCCTSNVRCDLVSAWLIPNQG
jgi:hypothetical protein